MKKTAVTVVIITKNEGSNIAECLDSVAEWVSEIVLVDDESSDETIGIAKKYTDKIFIRKMENEGKHRNWAYAQASNDWVLSLDADERITKELACEIADLLKDKPRYKAYTVPRKNYIGSYWLRHGGEYPASQTKLFLRDEFKYEEAEVHPRAFLEGDCGHLHQPMIHYSHKDITDYIRSTDNQSTLEARKWFLTKRKMSFGHALWRTLDRCFYRRLLRKKAYKDGVYGLTVAVLSGMYQLLSYLKYKEMMMDNEQKSEVRSTSEFVKEQNKKTTLQAREMFEVNSDITERVIKRNLKGRPIKQFCKEYVINMNFMKGTHGLVSSVLSAWIEYVKWAKYWEIKKEKYGTAKTIGGNNREKRRG